MAYQTDVVTKSFVAMAFKRHQLTPTKMPTACYELQIPEIHRTQQL